MNQSLRNIAMIITSLSILRRRNPRPTLVIPLLLPMKGTLIFNNLSFFPSKPTLLLSFLLCILLRVLLLFLRQLSLQPFLLPRPGALLVLEQPRVGGRVFDLFFSILLLAVLLIVLVGCFLVLRLGFALLLLVAGDVVDGDGVVGAECVEVADVVVGGGVGGVAELVEGVVLLVEEKGLDGGVLHETELVIAHALGDAVLRVRVGRALDGGPELVVGGVEAHQVLSRVDGPGEGRGG
ncbi:hypothetical protein V8G54_028165 [Vigna mungo]|uniref:Uncharacterized protein n=1 Tax=Vigna mungo TaxID=3915 RepID=A0AAQ3MSV7_VIGMU